MRSRQHQNRRLRTSESGQATVEFAFVGIILLVLIFGLIDFGRFIYERQVMVNLTREGSNLASRATSLSNTVDAVITSANPLNITTKGKVFVTTVTNKGSGATTDYRITAQLAKGGLPSTIKSKVGNAVGAKATMPAAAVPFPQPKQFVYTTEVFYTFTPITPIGKLLNFAFPAQIYDIAYF